MVRTPVINPEKHLRPNERIYYHYEDLEEFHAGMWRIIRGERRKNLVETAAVIMRDSARFKDAMMTAASQWVKSCEANLTAEGVNKIAWLGHAGCCVDSGIPEDCTRAGWHTLTQAEQDEANRVAAEVLEFWQQQRSDKKKTTVSNITDLFSYRAKEC